MLSQPRLAKRKIQSFDPNFFLQLLQLDASPVQYWALCCNWTRCCVLDCLELLGLSASRSSTTTTTSPALERVVVTPISSFRCWVRAFATHPAASTTTTIRASKPFSRFTMDK